MNLKPIRNEADYQEALERLEQIPAEGHSPYRVIASDYDEYFLTLPNYAAELIEEKKAQMFLDM